MVYTHNMSRNNTLILLLLTALSVSVWAQNTDPAGAQPPPANAADNAPVIEKGATEPVRPQRPSGSTARGSFPKHVNNRLQLLTEGSTKQSARWLQAGNERFLALWNPDRSGDGKGALLIIHAEGELPTWPQTTAPIHNTLPDYGWATLAISLPSTFQNPMPKRSFPVKAHLKIEDENDDATKTETQQSQPKPAPATNNAPTGNPKAPSPQIIAATKTRENLTEERITAALKFLHDRGQFNVALMGAGVGAIRAHRFMKNITPQITDEKLKDKLEKPIRALVAYNARNRLPTDSDDYKDWFIDPEIPFLDIYTTTDKRNQQESRQRRIMAKKKKAIYKRVKLSEMSHEVAWGENRLSRRIRSFLDAEVKGIEIDNAVIK